MKNKFAKLFDLENHQVVIVKGFDINEDGKDLHLIEITTSLESMQPTVKAGFLSEEERDEKFETYTKQNAEKFIEEMKRTLEDD